MFHFLSFFFLFNYQVCYSVHVAGFGRYFDIGQQETADYSFNETSETCVLTLKGKAFPDSGPRRFAISFLSKIKK